MAPIIGFAMLLLSFVIALFVPFFNFYSFKKSKFKLSQYLLDNLYKITATLSIITFAASIAAQICLIYSFIISDYSVVNVWQNSHHLKPLIFKISGSWGNHEGSMLLLITIISGYSLAFIKFSNFTPKIKITTLSVQSFIVACFAAFTAVSSNPFARVFPVPISGMGLNPILQDIGLALHPPMLYLGYLGLSLVFSIFIAALLHEKIDQDFAAKVKNWLLFAYGFLTLGIGLGAWWAYRELGWGGYWFWDPVENISLIPWLSATILLHCNQALQKGGMLKVWSSFIAILTFILCLLGIFLTRSGILTSVHSFAIDASRGFFVIILILLIGGLALLIFGFKAGKISDKKIKKISFFSKAGMIILNNYFIAAALFVVLLGTIYPIFSRALFDQFISIGPSYYNAIFAILLLPFLFFLAFHQEISNKKILNKKTLLGQILAAIILVYLTKFYQIKADKLQLSILFLAVLALLKSFSVNKNSNLIMSLSHFGFALIIAGVVLTSSFAVKKEVNVKIGESLDIAGFKVEFNNIDYGVGKNFIARIGNFIAFKGQKEFAKLNPELRNYPIIDQNTNEAAIKHSIFGDLYLVIGTKDENENYALRAYFKPFIWFIWCGCLLIFGSVIFLGIKINKKTKT